MFTNIICLRKCSFLPFRLFLHCADVLSTRVPSSEVMHPWSSLLLPRRDGVGWSRDALVLLPEGFLLLKVEREGWRSLWSRIRCTRARFILGLGIQGLLSGGELLLPVLSRLALPPQLCTLGEVLGRGSLRGCSLFSVASPASSLHSQRGGKAGESPECSSS